MSERLIRKTVILAKLETIYCNDPTPTGAANAMLVSNLSINVLNASNVDRAIIRAYLGASEELVGARYKDCAFDIELVGSGELGVAPAWGCLMRSIGFAEVITEDTRVDYVPISENFESVTIYWYDDGVLHKMLGCRGSATLNLGVGQKPVISFKFMGIDGGDTAIGIPATVLTEWRVPQVVIDANSGVLTFDATHATTTAPVLDSGTTYPSEGLTLDLGVIANFQALLGGESVPITDRKVTGAVKLKVTAAQEVAFLNDIKNTTLHSIGLQHGTVANDKVMVYMPGVQMKEPAKSEKDGIRMIDYKLVATPIAGNDEIRITTSFT